MRKVAKDEGLGRKRAENDLKARDERQEKMIAGLECNSAEDDSLCKNIASLRRRYANIRIGNSDYVNVSKFLVSYKISSSYVTKINKMFFDVITCINKHPEKAQLDAQNGSSITRNSSVCKLFDFVAIEAQVEMDARNKKAREASQKNKIITFKIGTVSLDHLKASVQKLKK